MMQQPIPPEEVVNQATNPDPTIWDEYIFHYFYKD